MSDKQMFYLQLTAHEEAELKELGKELFFEGNYSQAKLDRFEALQNRQEKHKTQPDWFNDMEFKIVDDHE